MALATASLVAVGWTATAATTVVNSADFQDGTTGGWTRNGLSEETAPTVVSLGKWLQVANRAFDYDGPQINLPVTAGVTYSVSLKVKLAAGVPDSQARLVAVPGYTWIGNGNVNAATWTTLSGTYTPTATGTTQFYLGTADISGVASYAYSVDDISITYLDGGTPVVLKSSDFQDGTTNGWTGNGGASLSVYDDKVLSVASRQNDYDGIQLQPTLTSGSSYAVSLRIRLADGVTGTTSARLIASDNSSFWDWIGNTGGISAAGWTTITGNYLAHASGPTQLYIGTDAIAGLSSYGYLVDDIRITTETAGDDDEPVDTGSPEQLSTGFEDGDGGWSLRADGNGDPTVGVTTAEAHAGAHAIAITDRKSQGSGIQHTITDVLVPGSTYNVSAWVKFPDGVPVDSLWLSAAVTNGGTPTYPTLVQFEQTPVAGTWTHLTGTFQAPAFDTATVYFQTRWISSTALGNTSDLYIDDIEFTAPAPIQIEDLTPIKDTVSFPVGVAIDSRETVGAAKALTLKHFSQITAENAMKPENWYNADKQFVPSADADALIDFAQANDLDVYGHVLVWHSQTPAWFFQNDAGQPLTTSPADQAVLLQRMRDHIFNVAEHLADRYGPFGSSTNPLHAFDVVNEVVADSTEYADGLRRSPWYNILGPSYIDHAFEFANEAFNDEYADPAVTHPVTLFINDYNTEQSGKQARYHALVADLIERGVPVDGVGHQFHVALSTPVASLDAALTAFEDLPVKQAVTEFDVTTGTPVTQAKLIDQGYYFQSAFASFRAHASDLFSVTVWGLNDGRSWRNSSGAPLVFNDQLQAKPAYYGIVAGESDEDPLPAPLRTADVFQADVPATLAGVDSPEWKHLPLHAISANASFQLRWESDHLTVYAEVADATNGADSIQLQLGSTTVTLNRDGTGTATGAVSSTGTGYRAVAELGLDDAAIGDTLQFDIRVIDDGVSTGWNLDDATGTLTLVEPVSFVKVVGAETAPTIDGTVDAAWTTANVVTTSKQVQGSGGATAAVRTLWNGNKLYVLAAITDPTIDVSASDPWVQDSFEIFVDAGNVKNGSYRYDDTQIRVSAANRQSFGTGDEAYQAGRVQSATRTIPGGYLVEVSVDLLEAGGLGSVQGLDFQVNDATAGVRTAITNWADPTGVGYQSTGRWGVGELVDAAEAVAPPAPTVTLGASTVKPGDTLGVTLDGLLPGQTVSIVLDQPSAAFGGGAGGAAVTARGAVAATTTLATLTAGVTGSVSGSVTVPAGTTPGSYRIAAVSGGDVVASSLFTVLAAIASTGVDLTMPVSIALLLLFGGLALAAGSRRRGAALRS